MPSFKHIFHKSRIIFPVKLIDHNHLQDIDLHASDGFNLNFGVLVLFFCALIPTTSFRIIVSPDYRASYLSISRVKNSSQLYTNLFFFPSTFVIKYFGHCSVSQHLLSLFFQFRVLSNLKEKKEKNIKKHFPPVVVILQLKSGSTAEFDTKPLQFYLLR